MRMTLNDEITVQNEWGDITEVMTFDEGFNLIDQAQSWGDFVSEDNPFTDIDIMKGMARTMGLDWDEFESCEEVLSEIEKRLVEKEEEEEEDNKMKKTNMNLALAEEIKEEIMMNDTMTGPATVCVENLHTHEYVWINLPEYNHKRLEKILTNLSHNNRDEIEVVEWDTQLKSRELKNLDIWAWNSLCELIDGVYDPTTGRAFKLLINAGYDLREAEDIITEDAYQIAHNAYKSGDILADIYAEGAMMCTIPEDVMYYVDFAHMEEDDEKAGNAAYLYDGDGFGIRVLK